MALISENRARYPFSVYNICFESIYVEDLIEIFEEQTQLLMNVEKIKDLQKIFEDMRLNEVNKKDLFLLGYAYGIFNFVMDSYDYQKNDDENEKIMNELITEKMNQLKKVYQNL